MAKYEMLMPQMGESIAEGTILKWLKQEGDAIARDETILEISTDKVDSEIPAPNSGVLKKIVAKEGETVEVGAIIAEIETDGTGGETAKADGKPAASESASQAKAPASTEVREQAVSTSPPMPAAQNGGAITARRGDRFYSPLVRSIAKQENISAAELDAIAGTGAGGRVTKNDMMQFLEARTTGRTAPPAPAKPAAAPSAPSPATKPAPLAYAREDERTAVMPMDNMRKRIAEHMVMSKQTSPHVYSVSQCDMSKIVKYREAVKGEFANREGTKLTYTPFFVDAVIRAIKDFPLINSSIDGSDVIVKKFVNIGLAVALENGLIVPVIKDADSYNLVGLARATNDLAHRARNKQLKPDEVQGGTFSITNMGSFGNLFGIPVINQPQVAILGIGAIKKTPVVINDAIGIRDLVYLSLSYDHRIIDGAYGGQFLERVVHYLEGFESPA